MQQPNNNDKKMSAQLQRATKIFKAKSGIITLSAISFAESALPLPLLTDPFLAAGILIERVNTKRLLIATTLASVLGGVFAYLFATYFFDVLLTLLSTDQIDTFNTLVAETALPGVFVLSLLGAITPVPYTIVAWVVAAINGSLFAFIIASIIGRGFRYGVVAWTTYKFGPLALEYAKKYILITSVLLFILTAAIVYLKM